MTDPGGPGAPITPLVIDSDDARHAAARELAKPVYAHARPGEFSRLVSWLESQLNHVTSRLLSRGASGHGNWVGLAVLLALVLVIVLVVRWRFGAPRRVAGVPAQALFDDGPGLDAAGYRAEADGHAAAGRWAEAVRARLRAIIAGLEERTILTPRPGRTADVAARDAGAALPGHAAALAEAARIFDDIWYGEHTAREADHSRLAEIDAAVAAARPSFAAAPAADAFAEPR